MADDAGNVEYISLLAGRPPTTPGGPVKLPTFADVLVPQFALRSSTFVLSLGEVIVFIVTLFVGGLVYDGVIVAGNDMYGPSTQTLKAMGGKWEPDIRNNSALWRLVTPIFLHAGFLHIFSNLFFQLRLGFILERRWTMPLFLLTYVLTGIGSSLMSCVMSPDSVSVGASGALFGLLGAVLGWLVLNYPSLPVGAVKSEAIMVIVIAGINFLIGTTGSIDNWAHLGGFITGLGSGAMFLPSLGAESLSPALPVGIGSGTGYRLGGGPAGGMGSSGGKQRVVLTRIVGGVIVVGFLTLMSCLLWVGNP